MTILSDLTLDECTPVRVWAALDPETRRLAARALWASDPEMREQAVQALASTLNFRPAGVRKLSPDRRIDYLARRVRPDDALASSLLMALHLGGRQALLTAFLDELGIPNEDGLIDANIKPEPVEGDRLAPAITAIRERFPADEVDLYLVSLLALDPDTWGAVVDIVTPPATT